MIFARILDICYVKGLFKMASFHGPDRSKKVHICISWPMPFIANQGFVGIKA